TAIPVRRRRSQLPRSKEIPYRSTLRDPQGKAESAIGGVLAISEELETVILSDRFTQWDSLSVRNIENIPT
ncbi:hypothetical protein H8356DRAFT_1052115, partial [Neocallimastix lanati (nom. inval.)]